MIEKQRSFKPPKEQSYFLFGPRGVGKSRLLSQLYPKALFIDLLHERTLTLFLSQPERLVSLIHPMKDNSVVVIDEVQRAPSLLSSVHRIMESNEFPKIKFVLTGSSSRKLKKAGVDLLAGRALIKNLYPFTAFEMGPSFNMKRALETGLVPLVVSANYPQETLDAYIGIYLKEEVKQEGLVRNLESFSRFLEVMCFSHGEIMNLSNVARESSIKRSTVDGYLSILEDLLLGYRIPTFKIKNRKQTVESEKFFYFDVGVFNSLCPQGILENPNQFKGQRLEGLVAQCLRAWISYRGKKEQLFFWRTHADTEVDFVVYGPSLFLAIEVKSTREVRPEHLRGLRSFAEDYPTAQRIFLYMGDHERVIQGVRCIPVGKYLLSLKS